MKSHPIQPTMLRFVNNADVTVQHPHRRQCSASLRGPRNQPDVGCGAPARGLPDMVVGMETTSFTTEDPATEAEPTFDGYPQQPHGGVLVNQMVPESQRASETERARSMPS